MKKNILWMLAAILTCGLTVATMTACSSSDDDKTDPRGSSPASTSAMHRASSATCMWI